MQEVHHSFEADRVICRVERLTLARRTKSACSTAKLARPPAPLGQGDEQTELANRRRTGSRQARTRPALQIVRITAQPAKPLG